METKEQALEEFLKSVRIALNFILLYSKDHKSFIKSVGELKEKTEALFAFMQPVQVLFMPAALSIDGVVYAKMALHRDLAQLFHLRKVKSLTLHPGISADELIELFAVLALAPKEIIRSGGVNVLLSKTAPMPHCVIEDLDYSLLLRGEGAEVKDIWLFMLRSALDTEDAAKINEFTNNFGMMIEKVGAATLADDTDLQHNLQTFLDYVKRQDRGKFLQCSKSIFSALLKDKGLITEEEKIKRLKVFLAELTDEDYAQMLWNSVVADEHFDVTSFQLFSKLLDNDKHERIARQFAGNLASKDGSTVSAGAAKKIKELFLENQGSFISEIYRQAILSMGAGALDENRIVFDRAHMALNYRFILLDLLLTETHAQRLELILDRLAKDWDAICAEKNAGYFRSLLDVIKKRKADGLTLAGLDDIDQRAAHFIESLAWQETVPQGFAPLIDGLTASSLGVKEYLHRIFDEGLVSSRIIALFFKFFPGQITEFYAAIEEKHTDIELVARILEGFKSVDSPMALSVLENIFAISSDIIKIEVLKIMGALGRYNKDFIFDIIRTESSLLKKEALLVLTEQQDYQRAMEMLFIVPNPWGKNNPILIENLSLVEELGYKRSWDYLDYLLRNTAFWNFALKKRIKEVMGRLRAGNG